MVFNICVKQRGNPTAYLGDLLSSGRQMVVAVTVNTGSMEYVGLIVCRLNKRQV